MKQKKNMLFGMLVFLAVFLSFSVSAQQYCTPDNCPYDYNDAGVDCSKSGLDYECTRTCEKEIDAHCDDNWGWSSESNLESASIEGRESSIYVNSDWQSSDKCYKYYAEARVNVDDWNLGTLCSEAESFNLELSTPTSSGVSYQSSCSNYGYEGISSSSWKYVGRGSSGTTRSAGADITAYKNTGCYNTFSSSSCGIKDTNAEVEIKWKTADWIPRHTETTTEECSGQFECLSGDTDCKGSNNEVYYTCQDHNWKKEGIIKGKCGVECKNTGETRCDNMNTQKCENYKWVDKGKIIGNCGVECKELDKKRCSQSGDSVEKCANYQWKSWETCDFKCKEGQCIECESGDTDCRGTGDKEYYTCESNSWKKEGIIKGKCGVECTNTGEIKCSENGNAVQCIDNEWKITQYCNYCKDGQCVPTPPEPELTGIQGFFNNIFEWFQKTF